MRFNEWQQRAKTVINSTQLCLHFNLKIEFIVQLLYSCVFFYVLAKPALNILVYVSHAPDSQIFTRLATAIIFLACLSVIFTINLLCASVTSAAHKPLKTLHNSFKMKSHSLFMKLKVITFIGKLSEKSIGFYCYKLYPMNNYSFYEYLCGWAYNYFLIMIFLRKRGFIKWNNTIKKKSILKKYIFCIVFVFLASTWN